MRRSRKRKHSSHGRILILDSVLVYYVTLSICLSEPGYLIYKTRKLLIWYVTLLLNSIENVCENTFEKILLYNYEVVLWWLHS